MNFNLEDQDDDFHWERAFHEAGHIWVARRLGVPVRGASIWTGQSSRPPMYATDAADYALAGLLAQALSRELGDVSVQELLQPMHACEFDLQVVWEAADDIAGGGTYCCRGSDPEAVPLLAPEPDPPLDQITPMVNRLLYDWRSIDQLAESIFSSNVVNHLEVNRCLRGVVTTPIWPGALPPPDPGFR